MRENQIRSKKSCSAGFDAKTDSRDETLIEKDIWRFLSIVFALEQKWSRFLTSIFDIFLDLNSSPAKIKNLPLGKETGDSETGDRRRKKTIDNYPIHKT
jgi:hypothetical protein